MPHHAIVLGDDVPDVSPQFVVCQRGQRGVQIGTAGCRASAATPSSSAARTQHSRRRAVLPSACRCSARVSSDQHGECPSSATRKEPARLRATACRRTARARPWQRSEASWSMPPVGAPTKSFSARRETASSVGIGTGRGRADRRARSSPSRRAPRTRKGPSRSAHRVEREDRDRGSRRRLRADAPRPRPRHTPPGPPVPGSRSARARHHSVVTLRRPDSRSTGSSMSCTDGEYTRLRLRTEARIHRCNRCVHR